METMTKKGNGKARGALAQMVDTVGEIASSTSNPLVLHDPLKEPKDSKLAFTGVKVFSATKQLDRNALGEMVTDWLHAHPGIEVVDKVVTQSSDSEFHCLTITLFYR